MEVQEGEKKKKRDVSSILSQGMDTFMSITSGDGGNVARGTEPGSELLTHCLGATCTLLPCILWLML